MDCNYDHIILSMLPSVNQFQKVQLIAVFFLYLEPWAAVKKTFMLVWHGWSSPARVLGQNHLPQVSRQSYGQLGDHLMKAVRPVIASDGIP